MRRFTLRSRRRGVSILLQLTAAAAAAGLTAGAPASPADAEAASSEETSVPAPLERFEGVVRPTAGLGVEQILAEEIGSLRIEAAEPGADLREQPGEVVLELTDGSILRAGPGVANRVRFDPDSGLRLDPDAPPDAVCTTGQELDCWQPGDPVMESGRLSDALCDATLGFLPDHPSACITDLLPRLFPETISLDFLSAEQQALLGCGPFFGTDCADADVASISFALLHALAAFSDLGTPSSSRDGCSLATPDLCHPFIPGQPSSEIATLSFNLLFFAFVCSSSVGFTSDPLPAPELCSGVFDPNDPFGLGSCSFRNPEACGRVRVLLAQTVQELDDDPDGPPSGRLLWQSGSEHPIVEATGSLAVFQGGTLHLAGPEVSRVPGTSRGAPLILLPPDGAAQPLDSDSPLVRTAAAGPDGMAESGDETALGLGYVVALPEPSESLLGAVAVAVLAGLARARRGRGVAPTGPGRPA